MTKNIVLNAKKRENEEKVSLLKGQGDVPAVVYGPGYDSRSLSLNAIEFEKIYASAGTSTMIGLKIDADEPIQIIIKDVQFNHKNQFVHADFYKIDETKKMTAPISLDFIGESDAVNVKKGILSKNLDFIEVECLPSELVSHIDVNISVLKNIGDSITIKDLDLPEAFSTKNDDNDSVVSVVEPQKEVEPEPTAVEEGEKAEDTSENSAQEKEGDKKEDKK
ncbi:MAG: 50S ribosomal protein L25 [Patescibacteria group bacterium]|jgi:large subunit ribosomal protein L25|nr:50S ribosomal protein L25 [Patescibacteria group bacterium]